MKCELIDKLTGYTYESGKSKKELIRIAKELLQINGFKNTMTAVNSFFIISRMEG